MHRTQGWIGLRSAVIALGLLAYSTTSAKSDVISNSLEYSTSGGINTATGVTGPNVISYVPVTNADVSASSNLSLGSFQVAGLTGQTTNYNNTPFTINFLPSMFNGSAISFSGTNPPPSVTGYLNGTVDGPSQTNVVVSFSPVANGSFPPLSGASSTLTMLQNEELLVPASAGGNTTVEGIIATSGSPFAPIPEPSTIALFMSAVGGLGLRRYVLGRRQRAQS